MEKTSLGGTPENYFCATPIDEERVTRL